MSALSTMGQRLGRHAGTYSIGSALGVVLGLVSVAVITRFLDPSEYGVYALYVALAGTLGMVYGLVVFKGSLRTVFGGDDDEGDEEGEEGQIQEGQARRALGTALVLTGLVAAIGTAVMALVPQAAQALIAQGDQPDDLILFAAAAGGAGAVWRLAATVPRRERRSTLFVVLQTGRPLLVLAATVPLVVGQGLRGAILGLMIGNAAAAAGSLVAIRHSWVPAFERSFVGSIGRRGSVFLPLVLSFWAIQEGAIFLLAQFAPASEVGVYRVASQVAAFGGFIVVAFLRASGPMTREPIYKAARRERGPEAVSTLMATYFALGAILVLLAFALAADALVRIAPPAYAAAAPLVPLLVLGAIANGVFRVVYRYSRFPSKLRGKIIFAVVAGVVFFVVGLLIVPELGAYGIAWATTAGFAVAAAGLYLVARTIGRPVAIAHRRVAAGVVIAAACFAAGRGLEQLAGVPAWAVAPVLIAAYPVLLVVTGIVPRQHVRPLADISRASLPLPQRNGGVPLRKLTRRQRRVLRMIVRDGQPTEVVAARMRTSEADIMTTFMAGLRRAGGLGKPAGTDADVAGYLLSSEAVADRDSHWRRLDASGVDPLETDALAMTLERLRRAPRSAWKRDD